MLKNISPELLQKYMDDKCTPEEIEEVQLWYDQFESENDLLDSYTPLEQSFLKRKMLDHVKMKIQNAEAPKQKNSYKHVLYWAVGTAAVLVLALKLFFLNAPQPLVPESTASLEVTNQSKNILKQVLPDGSLVWLSPATKLSYPKSFSGRNYREVKMMGKAFFEVVKDHAHPFIIRSGEMTTRVWGTSFEVTALPNSSQSKVVVLTGKVSVEVAQPIQSKMTAEVMLQPNQQAIYSKPNHILKKEEHGEMASVKIWKKVNLSFNNTPVKDVIAVLNKEFNVNIVPENKEISAFVLKADFNGQNFPDIMEMIKKSLDVNYQINERNVVLTLNTK